MHFHCLNRLLLFLYAKFTTLPTEQEKSRGRSGRSHQRFYICSSICKRDKVQYKLQEDINVHTFSCGLIYRKFHSQKLI